MAVMMLLTMGSPSAAAVPYPLMAPEVEGKEVGENHQGQVIKKNELLFRDVTTGDASYSVTDAIRGPLPSCADGCLGTIITASLPRCSSWLTSRQCLPNYYPAIVSSRAYNS